MDEFQFYADRTALGVAGALIEIPQAQFLLMSATMGDVCGSSRTDPEPGRRPRWSPPERR